MKAGTAAMSLLLVLGGQIATAQAAKKDGPEFTKQALLGESMLKGVFLRDRVAQKILYQF